jgi:hypothetical protein
MLGPFVLNLLISCSLLLLAGWTGDTIATWVGVARRSDVSSKAQRKVETGRRLDHAALTACTSCGTSGDWMWKIDHPELN